MSIARVTIVKKSQKPFTCEKCGKALPKGSTYRHFKVGFRARYVHRRCMDVACTPRNSELDASKMAAVWDAQETFEAAVDSAESADDLTSALSDYAEALREVGEEYREASENPDTGAVFNTEAEERADTLESAADEVEGIDVDDETTDCDNCNGTGTTPCEECDGSGEAEDASACPTCSGEGTAPCDVEGCEDGQVPDLDAMRDAAREALNVDLP